MTKISIFTHTCEEYSNAVKNHLGKGYEHARILYQEWFRTGKISLQNPAFKNCENLFYDIVECTDFSHLIVSASNQEGSTGKILLKTDDQLEIESVLIPMKSGNTLCVSSQIGCRMGCSFCETGRMGLIRHLSTAEIVSQVFVARFKLDFKMRNIVFMGMGEPFDNYDAVMQAVRIFSDPHGFGFGCNHITLSTSGRIEGIQRLMKEPHPIPNLAVSINAPNDLLRNKLMPINRSHDMQALYETIKNFCEVTGKQILIAYVLLKDKNDSLEHAEELANYLKGLNVKINLIPYNPQSNDRYAPPDENVLNEFTKKLRDSGYYTLLRQTKGRKIMAGCGQLGNVKLKRTLK